MKYIIWQCFVIFVLCIMIYICVLVLLALKKYLKSSGNRSNEVILKKSLGEIIRNYRIRCNMTQEFVAEYLGVSRQAVSKWENGKSDPSTFNLIMLAKLFECSAEEMLKTLEDKNKNENC